MADKEAMIFVIDLGATMAHIRSGRDESDLDWAMRFVWSKLSNMAASGRKTLCAGVVAFRTDGTDNHMQDESGYENITVLLQLGPVTLQTIRDMRGAVTPRRGEPSGRGGGVDPGDALSAVVVAVDLMDFFTKKLKWLRRIYLVTDGRGQIDTDGVEAIGRKIKQSDIQLTVLGLDFDDAEYGFKEEDKDPAKARNEKHLRDLVALCDNGSQLATLAEAVESLDVPTVKQVRPYKSYDGPLTLGDPDQMPCAVTIYVERYFKTHRAIPVSATTVTVKGGSGGEGEAEAADEVKGGAGFAGVKNSRTYRVSDPAAPGGKRDVDFESLAKGYEYGRTAVHISESEHNVTKLESVKGFTILGFMLKSNFEPFYNMSEAGIVVARRKDLQSQLALSSLVWALDEINSYAVARIVAKEGRDPVLVMLVPCIEPGFEALYDLALPFAEDVRSYQFPPLDRIVTVSGATVTSGHRLLPGDELAEAMDEYVDAMDLSEGGGGGGKAEGEGQEKSEYAQMEDVYNPTIHRINHAIRSRALFPDKPVPAIPSNLLRYASPPGGLVSEARREIDRLVEASEVKKVPPKTKSRRFREVAKPLSGLDVDALLGQSRPSQTQTQTQQQQRHRQQQQDEQGEHHRQHQPAGDSPQHRSAPPRAIISRDNAIPEFKRALVAAEQTAEVDDAAGQMGAVIRSLISDSFGDALYDRALENLGAMRSCLAEAEEPDGYNRFARDLKRRLLSGELGGDRRDFWFRLRKGRLGLIDSAQSDRSVVTAEDSDKFYKSSR